MRLSWPRPRWIPAPLTEPNFRLLWAGMSLSYAGDRLQELAQGWLVASLTGSALAVGWIGALASLPMFLMPLGGVIADQSDRRKLMIAGQAVGVATTLVIGLLVWSGAARPWHIYAWAVVAGLVWMVMRPAYKAALTGAVPAGQVRQAVGINSITETLANLVMNGAGGMLVAAAGLPVAFLINALTYLVAIGCLTRLPGGLPQGARSGGTPVPGRVLADLRAGLAYLLFEKELYFPLLQTFVSIVAIGPATGLLAAIVQKQGGDVAALGLLGAAASLGALGGAVFAAARGEGDTRRTYALLGLGSAGALSLFILDPLGPPGVVALPLTGAFLFAQAVWNTSRVPRLAGPAMQSRLQALTTMAFTLGGAVAALLGGLVLDRFGLKILFLNAGLLAAFSIATLIGTQRSTPDS